MSCCLIAGLMGMLPHIRFSVQGADLDTGSVFADPFPEGGSGPEMVVVGSGTFRMGDLQEKGYVFSKPVHRVTIARPFALGRFEVTFAEFDRFCLETGRPLPDDKGGGRGWRPVIHVSWNDARVYAEWLSLKTGKHYRLPSEAEWEYAVRGGTETARFWGNDAKDACRYANVADQTAKQVFPKIKAHQCTDGIPYTGEVGSFAPNAYGLYDMLGNVWEWCEDSWHSNYKGAPTDGRPWVDHTEGNRVRRGGSWFSLPKGVRSSSRNGNPPDYFGDDTGFRVARELDEK